MSDGRTSLSFEARAEVYDQYDGEDNWVEQIVELHTDVATSHLKDSFDGRVVRVIIEVIEP